MGFYMTPDFYDYGPFAQTPTTGTETFEFVGALLGIFAVFYIAAFALSVVFSRYCHSICDGSYNVNYRRMI